MGAKVRLERMQPAAAASKDASDDAGSHDAARDAWSALMSLFLFQRERFIAGSEQLGLTPLHAGALRMLALNGPTPMRALAGMLHCDASNVTGIVDRLERRGLAARQSDPADRRVKLVQLTPQGVRAHDQLERALLGPPVPPATLSEREWRTLQRLADKLHAALDEPPGHARRMFDLFGRRSPQEPQGPQGLQEPDAPPT
jgi:DNA-binding MarR family transcriptional regulator